jgi:ATP-dependent Lhr-like helicase
MMTPGQKVIQHWYQQKNWHQFPFQKEMEAAYLNGFSGLLNAPTGSGKTFALFLPFLADFINNHPDYKTRQNNGLQMLWITPLRALTNDIRKAMQEVCDDLQIPWKIATRTGDTPAAEKAALKKKLPEVLLTTPESLHLMLAQKEYPKIFQSLQVLVVDEWHELLGTKRGVQVELGLSKLKVLSRGAEIEHQDTKLRRRNPGLKIWGISATIGNLEQAAEVLFLKISRTTRGPGISG